MAHLGGNSTKQRPADERFWEKVDAADCWEWQGAIKSNGYGNFCPVRTRTMLAHRYAWETLVAPIPRGMTLDHQCRNRRCVNPDHLRLLTQGANSLAGYGPAARNARKTHCKAGHPLGGSNLHVKPDGSRVCIACRIAKMPLRNAARRARRAA